MKNRPNSPDTSGLLQTLGGPALQRADRGHGPETAESAGTPQMVDEGPTKHWTTLVVTLTSVSAECRCGWVEDIPASELNRVERASAAMRLHRKEAVPGRG